MITSNNLDEKNKNFDNPKKYSRSQWRYRPMLKNLETSLDSLNYFLKKSQS